MKIEEFTDLLEVEGIFAKGYGMISRMVMQDTRLSPESKAIYSYFCSYEGEGKTDFPKLETILYHLNMGKTRYYKHLKPLKELGYIN